MPEDIRKMAFWEIAKGSFAREFQGDFEKAQEIANRRGLPVTVSASINIFPERKEMPGYGSVEFQTNIKQPPKKSMRHVTQLKDGKMIKDGLSLDEVNQLDLDLPGIKPPPFVPPADRAKVMPPTHAETGMGFEFDPTKHHMGPDGTILNKNTGEILYTPEVFKNP